MIRVLFVCTGNICRSPTAEGVFRQLVLDAGLAAAIDVDSAGTHGYHVDRPADARAQEAASRRGIDLSALRARRVDEHDFEAYDYILAMDAANLAILRAMCPPGREGQLQSLLDFAPEHRESEVPDPYYGGDRGFERVLDLIEAGCAGLLATLRREHNLNPS